MDEQRTAAAVLAALLLTAGATACSTAPGAAAGPAAATGAPGSPPSAGAAARSATARATANGVEALAPQQVVDRALAALKQARSVRITGDGSSDGQSVTFDLSADTDGNCAGTMGLSGQGTFRLVKRGTSLWVKPDPVFWRSHGGQGAEQLIGDKYLKTTTENTDFAAMGTVCDLDTLAGSLSASPAAPDRGKSVTVNGAPAVAVPVTGTGGAGDGVLSVATRGEPYPLRLELTGGSGTGRVDLKEFGTPVPSGTPGPDETLDLDQLNGGGTPGAEAGAPDGLAL
ncbi:hypothetical protein [Kitasatospora sp. NPDC059571]|uniref:hypothetical protein n=1 Tax=Kitasatospora sp. NPDC059571 TaxID=3346871 RepID=UPI0036C233B6